MNDMTIHTKATELTATDKQQLGELFSSIAGLANILDDLLLEESDETTREAFHAVFPIVKQIGWMADLGSHRMGGTQMRGNAENWLMPPSYHWTVDQAAQ